MGARAGLGQPETLDHGGVQPPAHPVRESGVQRCRGRHDDVQAAEVVLVDKRAVRQREGDRRGDERVVDPVFLDHAQDRYLGHSAGLMERAAGRAIDQSLVSHVLEHALQVDLLFPRKPERPSDFALPRRLVGRGDEVEDLLAAGQVCGALA